MANKGYWRRRSAHVKYLSAYCKKHMLGWDVDDTKKNHPAFLLTDYNPTLKQGFPSTPSDNSSRAAMNAVRDLKRQIRERGGFPHAAVVRKKEAERRAEQRRAATGGVEVVEAAVEEVEEVAESLNVQKSDKHPLEELIIRPPGNADRDGWGRLTQAPINAEYHEAKREFYIRAWVETDWDCEEIARRFSLQSGVELGANAVFNYLLRIFNEGADDRLHAEGVQRPTAAKKRKGRNMNRAASPLYPSSHRKTEEFATALDRQHVESLKRAKLAKATNNDGRVLADFIDEYLAGSADEQDALSRAYAVFTRLSQALGKWQMKKANARAAEAERQLAEIKRMLNM